MSDWMRQIVSDYLFNLKRFGTTVRSILDVLIPYKTKKFLEEYFQTIRQIAVDRDRGKIAKIYAVYVTFVCIVIYLLGEFFIPADNQWSLLSRYSYLSYYNLKVMNLHKQSKQKRNDLVQLLLDASVDENELSSKDYSRLTATADDDTTNKDHQESSKMEQNGNMSSDQRKLNENEIIAQCIVFFVAGFETTATTLTHLIYELAVNQDVQQRLLDDIMEHVGSQNQDSDEFYDKLMKIPLIDAVIKETLRKYPPLARVERRVSVDGYKLGPVTLHKDQLVEVPVYAIHHSEEYYPEPERFNPDRFMPENKHLLVPYTYLPFGQGPRNCVGMRFAYQEIKLFIAQILPRYRFETTPETSIPLKFKKTPLLLNPGDVPIKVCRR